METISLIGLGKLGLPLAACLAQSGYRVLGIDLMEHVIDAINAGKSPISEPGLPKLLEDFGGKTLIATQDHKRAIEESDITIILTATPSNPDGSFSNRHVEAAILTLAEAYRDSEKPYHLFIISSTVVPGSTESSFIPIIENISGKKLNRDFGVAFDPDFVALGSVVKNFLNPDLVIIGESDKKAGDFVQNIHQKMCQNHPQISRMSIINAELAKVCLNAYITMKITFANTISNLCERIPGTDCDAITKGIGADKRISPYYFSGGLAFGGTCFPRDTKAFRQIAEKFGLTATLLEAVDDVNAFQHQNLLNIVLEELETDKKMTVGIMGLAFKESTPVITESPGIKLIEGLLACSVNIVAYDPLAIEAAQILFNGQIQFVDSATKLLSMSDLAVMTYRSKDFHNAVMQFQPVKPLKIIDCWRQLDGDLPPLMSARFLGKGK